MAEIGRDVERAARLLEQGELVAIPTETVYGLAGNALDPSCVVKIFTVKNRPFFDPLIVHVASANEALRYVSSAPAAARTLMNAFWPGPLTLILPHKGIPDIVTAGLGTVGLRHPRHPLTEALLQRLPFPLAAPSANPFGYISPTTPEAVSELLGNRISYILDGGACSVGVESTIVGFERERPIVYRPGGIDLEAIERALGDGTKPAVRSPIKTLAPGMLKSHYAPKKPLSIAPLSEWIQKISPARIGGLCFQHPPAELLSKHVIALSPQGNLEEAARRLFISMRALDAMDIDVIWAELAPSHGIGVAINDRLTRAAAGTEETSTRG